MIDLLILLLKPALDCVEGGSRNPLKIIAALLAYAIDLIIANTTWRLIAGPLQGKEKTMSDSLERLCLDTSNPDQELFIQIAKKINSATGYKHIKAV